jgi:hypothetical protein
MSVSVSSVSRRTCRSHGSGPRSCTRSYRSGRCAGKPRRRRERTACRGGGRPISSPPRGSARRRPGRCAPHGWSSDAVPPTARRRHPRSRRRHLEVTGGTSARDRLAERRSGQHSPSLRRVTVTTTLNPSKTRSMPVTLRKSMRRVEAVVTRTGSVSSARLVSRPRNERPPVRVAWTTGANAGPTCPAERRRTETDPHRCSPASLVWSDGRNSRIAPADDPRSCRTTRDVPARGLSIETQLTIPLDGLLLPR